MIAHDRIGMNPPTGLIAGFPKALFERLAGTVGGEDDGAVVAAVDHVVKSALAYSMRNFRAIAQEDGSAQPRTLGFDPFCYSLNRRLVCSVPGAR